MSKAAEMAKVSAKGGFHVLWGLVASTVISAVGTIVIANLLGAANFGLYGIAIAAPNLIASFRDWGIATAMIKYSAQYNSESDVAKIRNVFVSGLVFEIILGLALSMLSFFLSGFLANLFSRPTIAPLIQVTSFFILTNALVSVSTAAFTGMETMHLNSIMQIVQSIVKTVVIVGLVLLGLGSLGAVIGFTLSVLVAGVTGVLLMWIMYRSLPKPVAGKLQILETAKTMLRYGFPVSIGNILSGFLAQFTTYFLAIYVTDNALIGNYNVAQNFVVLITFFAVPVSTMLFPAFSKLDWKKEPETLNSVFQYSVKYASLLVVPVAALVIALSQPAIATIFQNNYKQAPLYLALLSISYIFSALGNLSIGNLIYGQGYPTYNLKLTILTVAIGFPLGFILISQFGVIGLIVASLTAGLPSLLLSLRFIKNKFKITMNWVSSSKILFSSAVAAVLTYTIHSQLAFSSQLQLIIGAIVFTVIFIILALGTRTIDKSDLNNLREMIHSLGPLRKVLNLLLNIIEKLMKVIQK
jgi:O-antigen/teichoic acid export membrane protein